MYASIDELYAARWQERHNIDEHLPVLRRYAEEVKHITEFGVDRGWSTTAFLAARPAVLVSYDLVRQPEVELLEGLVPPETIWEFKQEDTRLASVEPTDLLFIDTEHTEEQVWAELQVGLPYTRRFVIFHDTVSCPAIVKPILNALLRGPWRCREWLTNQSGLAVFERI